MCEGSFMLNRDWDSWTGSVLVFEVFITLLSIFCDSSNSTWGNGFFTNAMLNFGLMLDSCVLLKIKTPDIDIVEPLKQGSKLGLW